MSSSLISQDVGPMVIGYGLVMGALAVGLRMVWRSESGSGPGAGTGAGATAEPVPRPAPGAGSARAARSAAPAAAGTAARSAAPAVPAPRKRVLGRARYALRVVERFPPGWPRFIAQTAVTAVGGYLVLMVTLILYYAFVVHVGGDFIDSGFTGCLLLVGLSFPVFLALSWLANRTGWRF
jgi:Family of unknown function (DUF6256)